MHYYNTILAIKEVQKATDHYDHLDIIYCHKATGKM